MASDDDFLPDFDDDGMPAEWLATTAKRGRGEPSVCGSDSDDDDNEAFRASPTPNRKTTARRARRAPAKLRHISAQSEDGEPVALPGLPAKRPHVEAPPCATGVDDDDVTLVDDVPSEDRTRLVERLKKNRQAYLREWQPETDIIPEHGFVVINGTPGSGKSTALFHVLYAMRNKVNDVILVTGSETTAIRAAGHIPSINIILIVDESAGDIDFGEELREIMGVDASAEDDDDDEDETGSFRRMTWPKAEEYLKRTMGLGKLHTASRMKAAKKNPRKKPLVTLIAFDDVAYKKENLNTPFMKSFYSMYRQVGALPVMVTQFLKQAPDEMVAAATHILTYNLSDDKDKEKVFKKAFGCVGKKAKFIKLLSQATARPPWDPEQRSCLVINSTEERKGAGYMECCYYFRPNDCVTKEYEWRACHPAIWAAAKAITLTKEKRRIKEEEERRQRELEHKRREVLEREAQQQRDVERRRAEQEKRIRNIEVQLERDPVLEAELPSVVDEALSTV